MSAARRRSGLMSGARLAAYSDGVIAIIVTIMVLDLHAPERGDAAALWAKWPTFAAYALSFVLVSIYWVNHHHLLLTNPRMDRAAMWLNIQWLFWLSMFPFATAYLSRTEAARLALTTYAVLGVLTALAYRLLGTRLSRLNAGVGIVDEVAPDRRRKNTVALAANALAIPAAFLARPVAVLLLVVPAVLYFAPDARVGSGDE